MKINIVNGRPSEDQIAETTARILNRRPRIDFVGNCALVLKTEDIVQECAQFDELRSTGSSGYPTLTRNGTHRHFKLGLSRDYDEYGDVDNLEWTYTIVDPTSPLDFSASGELTDVDDLEDLVREIFRFATE